VQNNEVIDRAGNTITKVVREGDELFAQTLVNESESLEKNKVIRNSGMLEKGELGLHDQADIRMAISCPSTIQWAVFKKKHADTYDLIMSKLEHERMRGAKLLQILHPDWVVMSRM